MVPVSCNRMRRSFQAEPLLAEALTKTAGEQLLQIIGNEVLSKGKTRRGIYLRFRSTSFCCRLSLSLLYLSLGLPV